jgi:hypothetical protein
LLLLFFPSLFLTPAVMWPLTSAPWAGFPFLEIPSFSSCSVSNCHPPLGLRGSRGGFVFLGFMVCTYGGSVLVDGRQADRRCPFRFRSTPIHPRCILPLFSLGILRGSFVLLGIFLARSNFRCLRVLVVICDILCVVIPQNKSRDTRHSSSLSRPLVPESVG